MSTHRGSGSSGFGGVKLSNRAPQEVEASTRPVFGDNNRGGDSKQEEHSDSKQNMHGGKQAAPLEWVRKGAAEKVEQLVSSAAGSAGRAAPSTSPTTVPATSSGVAQAHEMVHRVADVISSQVKNAEAEAGKVVAPKPLSTTNAATTLATPAGSPVAASVMQSPPASRTPLGSPALDEGVPTPFSSPIAPSTGAASITPHDPSAFHVLLPHKHMQPSPEAESIPDPALHRTFAAEATAMEVDPLHPAHPEHPAAQAEGAIAEVKTHLQQAEEEALVGRAALAKKAIDSNLVHRVQHASLSDSAAEASMAQREHDMELEKKLAHVGEEQPKDESLGAGVALPNSSKTVAEPAAAPSKSKPLGVNPSAAATFDPTLSLKSPVASSLELHEARVRDAEAVARAEAAKLVLKSTPAGAPQRVKRDSILEKHMSSMLKPTTPKQ